MLRLNLTRGALDIGKLHFLVDLFAAVGFSVFFLTGGSANITVERNHKSDVNEGGTQSGRKCSIFRESAFHRTPWAVQGGEYIILDKSLSIYLNLTPADLKELKIYFPLYTNRFFLILDVGILLKIHLYFYFPEN